MARFQLGDKVLTIDNKTFAGFTGQVQRIEQRRSGTWVWVMFPDHPWNRQSAGPFAFKPWELRGKWETRG